MATDDSAEANLPGVLRAELRALLARGQQIGAIERYRAATGADFASAKDVIDRFARRDGRAGRRWGLRSRPLADWLGLLTVLCWLCAFFAALASAWQAHERSLVSRSWPVIDAEVVKCRIDEAKYSRRSGPGGASLSCQFRYSVAGVRYTASTHSTGIPSREQVAAMREWIARRRPGTQQAIHYDPSEPRSISLGDADAAFQADTPALRLRVAGIFAGAGVFFFGAATAAEFVARRRVTL